jgi:DNA invertase Pin-like site-specific DNA recombinase
MKIGYARVSSSTQDLELQKEELLKVGCEKIFSESVSGKDNNRTQLIEMIASLRAKDVVVVYKIDRIARSLKGLIEIVELLKDKKVDLVSLDSGDRVDTTSPMGKAFFQIAGVFAELERSMINARTKAGIEKAKIDGVKFGRTLGSKNPKTAAKIEKMKIFLRAGKSYDWITKELSVSKKTVADIKKSLPSLSLQLIVTQQEVLRIC